MDEDQLHDLFASIAPIRIKRMFGGQGIYSEGLIVAVVVGGELMLKADAAIAPAFAEAGSRQWTYPREGRADIAMPYWGLPDDAYDDPTVMAGWARQALDAARRSAAVKPKWAPRKRPAATKSRGPAKSQ